MSSYNGIRNRIRQRGEYMTTDEIINLLRHLVRSHNFFRTLLAPFFNNPLYAEIHPLIRSPLEILNFSELILFSQNIIDRFTFEGGDRLRPYVSLYRSPAVAPTILGGGANPLPTREQIEATLPDNLMDRSNSTVTDSDDLSNIISDTLTRPGELSTEQVSALVRIFYNYNANVRNRLHNAE